MAKSDIIAGLDMGSSRVTCVLAQQNPETGKIRVLSGASLPCKGLKGGVVVDLPATTKEVAKVMEEAEEKVKEVAHDVYLGVRGKHIQTFNNRGAYNIARADKVITGEDVSSVLESAKAIPIHANRDILHVIPQGFTLDRQNGVPNPVGMEGALLGVDVHIVTAEITHINNLANAVSQAGFKVRESVYNLLAIGELVVTPEEKESGCILLDIGGMTTAVGVYDKGSLQFSGEIPIGGDHITRDISIGLGTLLLPAQQIKEAYGAVISAMADDNQAIKVVGLDGKRKDIKATDLLEFTQPRAEELFEEINKLLKKYPSREVPVSAILTGGGSLLKGMPEAAEQLLSLKQVRYGIPRPDVVECPEEYLTQTYTSAVAMVCYSSLKSWTSEQPRVSSGGGLLAMAQKAFKEWF